MFTLHTQIEDSLRNELSSYDDLTAALLARRNITTAKEAEDFLNPSYDEHLHNPMQMKNMPAAAARLALAIDKGEQIAVWSDYDADGIPGGVVLHDFLKKVGARFTNYIPHRHFEGYGVNTAGIEKLIADGATLIITVDSGITDIEPIARARELGADVIVTDHHELGEILPDAFAVIDPKQKDEEYPFRELCGAALAWKLVVATLAHGFSGREKIPDGWEKWLLDMVGLATVADMVPLVGENRVLAHYGLLVLRKSRRAGVAALCRGARVDQRTLAEDDIGFMIAPRVNAASRMGDPMRAFHLFATKDTNEARELARDLETANRRRRAASAAITRSVHTRLRENGASENPPPVIAMGDPQWQPSLLGLVAGTIAEEYSRPVFLWGREETKEIKGSCRSDGVTHILDLMNATEETFARCGGHAASGGFVVKPDAVFSFEERLINAFRSLPVADTCEPSAFADAELPLKNARTLLAHLEQFAPFGEGNKKPVWLLRDIEVATISWFGKNKEHLKLSIPHSHTSTEAIAFFTKHNMRERAKQLAAGSHVTMLAHLERDTFSRSGAPRLRILFLA